MLFLYYNYLSVHVREVPMVIYSCFRVYVENLRDRVQIILTLAILVCCGLCAVS